MSHAISHFPGTVEIVGPEPERHRARKYINLAGGPGANAEDCYQSPKIGGSKSGKMIENDGK